MSKNENNRTDQLIIALWRAAAKTCADSRIPLTERKSTILVAEHVEQMLRLTSRIHEEHSHNAK